jgi:hypothetical protein
MSNKSMTGVILALVTLWASPKNAKAQCTDYSPQVLTCFSRNCQGTYEPPPIGGGSTYDDTGTPASCCGHIITLYTGDGGCNDASLRTIEAKSTLFALLADGIELRVKSCRGRFQAYVPPISHPELRLDEMVLPEDMKRKG